MGADLATIEFMAQDAVEAQTRRIESFGMHSVVVWLIWSDERRGYFWKAEGDRDPQLARFEQRILRHPWSTCPDGIFCGTGLTPEEAADRCIAEAMAERLEVAQ